MLNAYEPIEVSSEENETVVSILQFAKARSSILTTALGILIVFKLMQSQKAFLLIRTNVEGNTMFSSDEHPCRIDSLNTVRFDNLISVIEVQLYHA